MTQISIKRNILFNVLKICSAIVIPLCISPYIYRTLLTENLGKVDFTANFVGYFSLVARLGVDAYAIRECAACRFNKDSLDKTASEIYSINILSTIFSYIILLFVLCFSKKLHPYAWLILIQSIPIVFTTMGADWINVAMEDFKYITIRTFMFQIFSVGGILLFVKKPDDYYKYVLIQSLTTIFISISNIFYRKRFCKTKFIVKTNLKKHLPGVLTLFVMLIAQTIYTKIDVTMLGLMRGDKDVGIYSIANKIYFLAGQPVFSVFYVVLPRFALYFENNDEKNRIDLLKKVYGFTMLLGIPSCVGVYVLAKELVLIFGGTEYGLATGALKILMISLFLNLLSGIEGNMILIPSHQEKFFMKVCCFNALVNGITNMMVIPFFGINGACWTTVLSTFLMTIILYFRARKYLVIDKDAIIYFVKPIVGCLCFIPFCEIIKIIYNNLMVKTLICIFGSVLIYFVVMLFQKEKLTIYGLQKIKKRIRSLICK